jgi:hypothetical protein
MKIVKTVVTASVVAMLIAAACSSNKDEPADGTGGGAGDAGGDVSQSGATSTGGSAGAGTAGTNTGDAAAGSGPLLDCGVYGDPCKEGIDCCSLKCNATTGTCDPALVECLPAEASCTSPLDCCTMRCEAGSCSGDACIQDDVACTSNDQCCSGKCDGTCMPLNTSCKTAGNSCAADGDCCSMLCANEVCQLASSFCSQQGDACARGDQCCSGVCAIAEGALLGMCAPPPSAPTNCGGVQGTVCSGCGDCCSRLCAPYGPTGVLICQPASGCRVMGELCKVNEDCCGGDVESGLPGAGNVTCEKTTDPEYGRCRSPSSGPLWPACNPQGNVCHFKDYACGNSSSRNNCCGDTGNKQGVCQLDALGVPRCNGLAGCREPGETCASAADCCNGIPCVPDAEGVLRCLVPEGEGPACVPEGGTCTYNGDCCVGYTCIIPVGSSQGVCGIPEGSGGPTCAEYGQTCSTSGDCCNQVPCTDGICRFSAN